MDASLVQRRLPEKSQETDSVQNEEINMMSDNIESTTEPNGASGAATTQTKKEERSGNILYQEFSYQVFFDEFVTKTKFVLAFLG